MNYLVYNMNYNDIVDANDFSIYLESKCEYVPFNLANFEKYRRQMTYYDWGTSEKNYFIPFLNKRVLDLSFSKLLMSDLIGQIDDLRDCLSVDDILKYDDGYVINEWNRGLAFTDANYSGMQGATIVNVYNASFLNKAKAHGDYFLRSFYTNYYMNKDGFFIRGKNFDIEISRSFK